MLITEWNWDDAKEVWQEEAREDGLEEGLEKGLRKGRQEGLNEGHIEVARKMKKAGYPITDIAEITGLSAETIEQIN